MQGGATGGAAGGVCFNRHPAVGAIRHIRHVASFPTQHALPWSSCHPCPADASPTREGIGQYQEVYHCIRLVPQSSCCAAALLGLRTAATASWARGARQWAASGGDG